MIPVNCPICGEKYKECECDKDTLMSYIQRISDDLEEMERENYKLLDEYNNLLAENEDLNRMLNGI